MGREIFLPGFAIADLLTLGEAVAIGVYTARLVSVVDLPPLPCRIMSIRGPAMVHAVLHDNVIRYVTQYGVEFYPRRLRWVEDLLDIDGPVCGYVQ